MAEAADKTPERERERERDREREREREKEHSPTRDDSTCHTRQRREESRQEEPNPAEPSSAEPSPTYAQGPFVAMQKPICLISSCSAGKPEVNQEALVVLNSISQPVVVVSIVGMYRTGKSYLMNRLAGKQMGFALGSTIQSETKGIWMWCMRHPYRDDQTLVLLDTEGLGDVAKGDQTHDNWIFSLAILLSSTFVYNSMGTINNEAVMSLHHVTELTEHIKVKSSEEKKDDTAEKFTRFFPTFIWAVRDFTQELRIDGEVVTADEYLENSLKLVKGNSPLATYSNGARKCIRNYFPTRKCFVFDQPTSKKKLRDIEELTDADMEPAFVQQTLEFCSYIFECSKEKTMTGGYKVTGQMLGNLAKMYVDAIRSGSVLCLENAVAALSKVENSAAVEESFALYTDYESFRRPGGYADYRVQLDSIVQTYRDTPGKGVQAEQALEIFMKEKNDLGASILKADRNLTEQDRKLREEEARVEMERFKAEVARKNREDAVKRLEDAEKAHRKNEQQLMDKWEREWPAIIEESKRVLDQWLKEQRALISEGFDKRAKMYVDAIRSGSVPCLENAVAALSKVENSVEEYFALYRRLLGERVKLHTETQEELSSAHKDQKYQAALMGQIKDEYDGKCSENAVLSQSHCTALLQQLWSQMDYESFMRPGGYADYRVQLDSIVQTYRDTPGKGVQAEQALEIVMKEKNDLGASILKADRNLTEQDRKLKEEEAHVEMERFKAEVARRNQEDAVKRLEDAEKAHRENEQQLMDKLERERRAIIEENQKVLDQRLKEQRALISEGFEQRARAMEAQVQSLQRELAASKSRGGGGGCVLL